MDTAPKTKYLPAFLRIWVHIGVGEMEKAIELIEKEYEEKADWLSEVVYDPVFASVRSDPRMLTVLEKLGVAQKAR